MVIICSSCGEKKCYTCGKTLDGEGYTSFGNNYCSHCFMYDLGLDKDSVQSTDSISEENILEESFESEETPGISADSHIHVFSRANCTNPEICSCGESRGLSLGHDWANATCTSAAMCRNCYRTSGSPIGHKWMAATYSSPKKCEICGETEGAALKAVFTGISINTLPYKTTYNYGEKFDSKGLTIRENYSDGSFKIKEKGFECEGFTSNTAGEKTITVTYEDMRITFTVNVVIDDLKLVNLKSASSSEMELVYNRYDSYGNYYNECLHFRAYSGWTSSSSRATYHLDNNYSRFNVTLAYEDYYLNYDYHINGDFIINIYADDELIYSNDNFTRWDEPIELDLDIKKCKFLKISVDNDGPDQCYLILANAEVKI